MQIRNCVILNERSQKSIKKSIHQLDFTSAEPVLRSSRKESVSKNCPIFSISEREVAGATRPREEIVEAETHCHVRAQRTGMQARIARLETHS